jgi:propanediol dehydratase large subunit
VQQQQQKSAVNAAAAAAAAAAARQGLNEINTTMTLKRFLTCGIVVF